MNTIWAVEINGHKVTITMGDEDARNAHVKCNGRNAIYHLFDDLHVVCVYGKPIVEIEGELFRSVIETIWLRVRAMREGPPC